MGIRENAYHNNDKQIEASIECKKLSDARRFINKQLNYLETKSINNMKISITVNFNDRKWEEYE